MTHNKDGLEARPTGVRGLYDQAMRRHAKQNVLLTLWLLAPIAVLAIIVGWIFVSLRAGPKMDEPGVGAGAGDTGGANAIGEMLKDNKDDSNSDEGSDEQSDD